MTQIIEINDTNFNKTVMDNSLQMPVLLKFWGNWCQPCKRMEPILKDLLIHYKNRIKIFSINVENNQIITNKFNIRSIPSLLLFDKKNLVKKCSGFLSEEQIKQMIESNCNI
jgi:thioredoxin